MTGPGSPGGLTADDEARFAEYGRALADGVDRVIADWVAGSVERVLRAEGRAMDAEVTRRAIDAGEEARADIVPRLRRLLAADLDDQRTNPLSVIRGATRYATVVLIDAGARPVRRDEQSVRHFPDDHYDLSPARFADLDPSLHEPGLVWGAAKAHLHLRRRRTAS